LIALDTNVVSELLRPQCDAAVLEWVNAQPSQALFLISINAAELWAGVALLPEGARKRSLESSLEDVLNRLFAGRRLSFDDAAARAYADIVRRSSRAGTPVPLADGLIAAVALSRGFAVATRDTAPFRAAGVEVIDPWQFATGA
jgi:predicted nucleic acid-binding protein